MFARALLAFTLPLLALSQVVPTSPDGSTVVNVGGQINALWTADTTGAWTDVEIQLMTGDNYNMVPLETLATGIDGTTQTSFSIAAPNVTPNSKIYFLQFTLGGNVSTATWTTRFTIAAADGTSTAPTNTTNYSGTDVQWGTGVLVDGATDPSAAASASASVTDSSLNTASSSTQSGLTVYNTDLPSSSADPNVSTSSAINLPSSSSSASSAAAAASSGAAGKLVVGGGLGLMGLSVLFL